FSPASLPGVHVGNGAAGVSLARAIRELKGTVQGTHAASGDWRGDLSRLPAEIGHEEKQHEERIEENRSGMFHGAAGCPLRGGPAASADVWATRFRLCPRAG